MPIIGRSTRQSTGPATQSVGIGNGLIASPINLPYPLVKGSVTFSDKFNGPPTAQIQYEGISAQEIERIEAAYKLGLKIDFYGPKMEVKGVRTGEISVKHVSGNRLHSYTVSITLEFPSIVKLKTVAQEDDLMKQGDLLGQVAYSDGLRPKSLGAGATWRFSRDEILEVGESAIAKSSEGYNYARLDWGSGSGTGRVAISPKRPEIITLVEQTWKPTVPPEDSRVIKDLSSNHDESGPTAYIRTTTTVDGTPERETMQIWGFAYLYEDATLPDGRLYSDNPGRFWQPIEYRETRHIYHKIEGVRVEVEIRDPSQGGGDGKAVKAAVHPDYRQYMSIAGGSRITVKTPNLFLTESKTTGRKWLRLVKETDERNTLDPTDPRYPLMQWRWVPSTEETVYLLKSVPEGFLAESGDPFRVEWKAYKDLEQRLKSLFSESSATLDGQVAILYPNFDFVEPLYVQRQIRKSLSYEWALDPDGEAEEADPPLPPIPPPHFSVGEESHDELIRTITDEKTKAYSEMDRKYSAQDPQFVAVAENVETRQLRGSLPSPTIRKIQFDTEAEAIDPGAGAESSAMTKKAWYVTTDNARSFRRGGSISIPGARSLSQAIAGLQVRLRRSMMGATQTQYKVAWFYPAMRPGDAILAEGHRWRQQGTLRVMSLSWKHTYYGATPLGAPLVHCDGMQLSCGLDKSTGASIQSGGKGSPEVNSRILGGDKELGRILPRVPSRRDF